MSKSGGKRKERSKRERRIDINRLAPLALMRVLSFLAILVVFLPLEVRKRISVVTKKTKTDRALEEALFASMYVLL